MQESQTLKSAPKHSYAAPPMATTNTSSAVPQKPFESASNLNTQT